MKLKGIYLSIFIIFLQGVPPIINKKRVKKIFILHKILRCHRHCHCHLPDSECLLK